MTLRRPNVDEAVHAGDGGDDERRGARLVVVVDGVHPAARPLGDHDRQPPGRPPGTDQRGDRGGELAHLI